MAVLKPSLRSSALREAAPGSLPTENPRQPSESRNSKRGRQTSSDHDSDASSKKLKTTPPHKNASKLSHIKRDPLKSLPFRVSEPNGVTGPTRDTKSRIDPVLVQPREIQSNVTASDGSVHPGINQNVPPPDTSRAEKRSLRSHDGGSRLKCELSQYFSNYDDLISIEPVNQDILALDTKLYIIDDEPRPSASVNGDHISASSSQGGPPGRSGRKTSDKSSYCMQWADSVFSEFTNATRITFPDTPPARATASLKDPLADSLYHKVHLREERKEKQLRNIEKERAMHEKVQLERILDGLRGHDWLRVMGISGITDGEKKLYEPKRDHLIKEVRALLEKFRLWKEEEKRRKAEKEDMMDQSDGDDDEASDEESGEDEEDIEDDGRDSDADSDAVSDGDPPGYSEADAAARQLRQEALQALGHSSQITKTIPSRKQEPFRSFFAKPYLRQAAISKHRRSGRTILAFGHPIPELWPMEFGLDSNVMTPEAILESGRRMRRLRRVDEEPVQV